MVKKEKRIENLKFVTITIKRVIVNRSVILRRDIRRGKCHSYYIKKNLELHTHLQMIIVMVEARENTVAEVKDVIEAVVDTNLTT